MAKKKIIKVGVDLDGVVAKHPLGGFWFRLRELKEKLLKKAHYPSYYYPSTLIEKLAWQVINWRREPSVTRDELMALMAAQKEVELYIVTSRFRFLEKMTINWLKKYQLDNLFYQIFVNVDDQDPLVYKEEVALKLGLSCFIDDDLKLINYLRQKTDLELYWINSGNSRLGKKSFYKVKNCRTLSEALEKIVNKARDIL